MKEEKIGALLEAFAQYYWSVPMEYVLEKIEQWHPEMTAGTLNKVLKRCDKELFWHHCCVLTDGLDAPELVTEHLIGIGDTQFDRFLATRMDVPYPDCDEDMLFRCDEDRLRLPEAQAIMEFARTEFGVDDGWGRQLLDDCILFQPYALCDGESWVKSVLQSESIGENHFRTIEQVERFRELGNRLYQVLPNPVFRGWRPTEVENAPALPDDIPASAEEIPDSRAAVERLRAALRKRLAHHPSSAQSFAPAAPKRKIGRNEPCPCGSGKKYKKCCGRRQMNG